MATFEDATPTTSGWDFGDATTFTTVIPDDNLTSNSDTESVTVVDGLYYPEARRAAMFMIRYLFPLVVFIGTSGNALTAAVLIRQPMRTTSVYAYLLALTVADTLVLYVSAFKTWIRVVTGIEWLHSSDAACRTLMFLFVVGLHLSAWLIVLVTLDRFIAVCLPLRAVKLCTVRRARIMIAALIVIMLVANSHIFWTIRLQYNSSGSDALPSTWTANGSVWTTPVNQFVSSMWMPSTTGTVAPPPVEASRVRPELLCAPLPGDVFGNVTFNYIKLATYSLIPFCIVIILNSCIIWRAVHVAPKIRRNFGGGRARGGGSSGQIRKECAAARLEVANGGIYRPITAAVEGLNDAVPMSAETLVNLRQNGGPISVGALSPRRVLSGIRGVEDNTEESGCGVASKAPENIEAQIADDTARTMTAATAVRRNSAMIGNRSNKDVASTIQVRQERDDP